MDFRQASPRKEAPKKVTKRKSAGVDEIQGQINFSAKPKKSNPVSRQRSAQMIQKETEDFDHSPWGDTDDDYAPEDDPIEGGQSDGDATDVDGDVPLQVAKRRRTMSGAGGGAKNAGGSAVHRDVVDVASASEISRGDSVSPTEWAYKQLKETYKRVSSDSCHQMVEINIANLSRLVIEIRLLLRLTM